MKVCPTCGREYADDQGFCANDGATLRAADGAGDLIGSIVADRYRILSKLGEGGMGAVYLGEHVKMRRKSAIKVIARAMSQDADAVARFNREAANAARITHPNVCAIYDFGETDDGLIYLAMEYVEGAALTDVILREGPLAPKRAGDILAQTADGLQAAHDLGIVHRDLKPDNIMIASGRAGADVVKVVDFGIAKAVGGDQDQKVTRTGLVVGTPEYMSPEQLSGDAVDARTDIYALALVFFRMLTGDLPFQADSAQEIMIKRLTDDPLKLNVAYPAGNFPPQLQEVMDRALARMPKDRYGRAGDFGRDVVEAVRHALPAAPPPGISEGATQLMGAPPPPGGATEVLPPTRISSASDTPTPRTPLPSTAVGGPAGGRRVGLIAAAVVGVLAIGGTGIFIMMNGPGDPVAQNGVTVDTAAVVDDPDPSPENTDNQPEPSPQRPIASGSSATTSRDPDPAPAPVTPTNPTWMNMATAEDHLLDLMDRTDPLANPGAATLAAIGDTAAAYYGAVALRTTDRALAAYVAAQAFLNAENRPRALEWARRAASADPANRSYRTLVDQLERGGGS